MKITHNIQVAGVSLSLISDSDKKYVESLADELGKRIKDIVMSTASATKLDAAIVCALDLLDENRRLKEELNAKK